METEIKRQIDRIYGIRDEIGVALDSVGADVPEHMVIADVPDLIYSTVILKAENGDILISEDGDILRMETMRD